MRIHQLTMANIMVCRYSSLPLSGAFLHRLSLPLALLPFALSPLAMADTVSPGMVTGTDPSG